MGEQIADLLSKYSDLIQPQPEEEEVKSDYNLSNELSAYSRAHTTDYNDILNDMHIKD